MRRVLIFSLAYFPKYVGGAEVAIQEITNRIDSPDIEFHLVCLRFDSSLPREEKIGRVHVHRIGFSRPNPTPADLRKFPLHLNKFFFQFLAPWKALSLHRAEPFDAIWAMMAHSSGVPAALFKLFQPRVPYILTLQEGDPPKRIERMMLPLWPLFKRAFTSADTVQVISNFLGAWARRMGYGGDIILVPNGVNTKAFSHVFPEMLIHEKKDALGKRMGDVFLVSTSRLVHKNALDDVIRALPHLPENVRFVNFGFGPDEHVLRALIHKLGLEKRVELLPHPGLASLPLYLKACDIFIRPSRSEGFGVSFVEAMAAGLPVIATQEGGIADFLFDEKRNPERPVTGFAVDKDSPKQIAEQVRHIMENPEKVRAVVSTAKAMVIEKYDWDVVARDMREKVFGRVLGQG